MTATPPPTNAKMSLEGDRDILVERIFNAPREKVWKAMTDPKLVAQWWGRGNKVVIEKMELVKGGHWRFVEHADGEEYGFEGRYREINPPESIEQTFEFDGMPGHVVVELATLIDLGDGRTKFVNRSTFFTGEDRDGMLEHGMETGMNQSYVALDKVLAAMG